MYAQPDPTWQYKYVTSQSRPSDPNRPYFGMPPIGAGAGIILPTSTRGPRIRSAQPHVSAEVYGTSPYLGRGDGVMLHTDTSSRLREGTPVLRGGRQAYNGTPTNRWDFVNVPLKIQNINQQLGTVTRLEPSYE